MSDRFELPPIEAYEDDGADEVVQSNRFAGPPLPSPIGRVGQIMGLDRFDVELEGWLIDRQWSVKLNQLSGELEIHSPTGVMPMTDERLSEIQFSLIHASNGKEPSADKVARAVGLIGERRAY